MVNFLFWNIKNKSLEDIIASIAINRRIDVIMLTECAMDPVIILKKLNYNNKYNYDYSPGIGCQKIKIFAKFSKKYIPPIYETDRLTVRHLKLPGLTDMLLAIDHFPSKLYWSEDSQALECPNLATSIKRVEDRVGHSRTVLVGDLNMNPFEKGVVSASGLHAVMSRRIAEKRTRTVNGIEYPFFYNPMWGLFGDSTRGPPGTFFDRRAEHVTFFWNIFDQVLVRPDLISRFDENYLEILDSDGDFSFLTEDGKPNESMVSDHLPILFKLQL
jgi:hypothetical protein